MKKMNVLWIMLDTIFLIVFNIIVFLLIYEHTAVFWISYVFIHFSYIMLVISSGFIPKTRNALVFGYPIIYISSVYFFVEFFCGILFFTLGKDYTNTAIVVQLIIAGLYGIIFVSNLIANEQTIEDEQQREKDIIYIKMAIGEMNNVLQQAQDIKVRKNIEKVYDAVKSSQVKTYPALAEIERDIIKAINRLKIAVVQNAEEDINMLSEQILTLVKERNQKIKLLH